MEALPIENLAQLPAEDFLALTALLRDHRSMKHALDWALAQSPPIVPEMVTQDEFSHDFLFRLPNGLYFAYDST